MSMPLSNALQSQIITDNHFLHHPKVDNELTRKYERARLDTENIYLLPGNDSNLLIVFYVQIMPDDFVM
ncbi:DUF2686 family protein, partial [Escherichia coli]|nr:DUF2686 family protein [Escherichia coli]